MFAMPTKSFLNMGLTVRKSNPMRWQTYILTFGLYISYIQNAILLHTGACASRIPWLYWRSLLSRFPLCLHSPYTFPLQLPYIINLFPIMQVWQTTTACTTLSKYNKARGEMRGKSKGKQRNYFAPGPRKEDLQASSDWLRDWTDAHPAHSPTRLRPLRMYNA